MTSHVKMPQSVLCALLSAILALPLTASVNPAEILVDNADLGTPNVDLGIPNVASVIPNVDLGIPNVGVPEAMGELSMEEAAIIQKAIPLLANGMEIPDNALIRKYRDQYTSTEGLKYLSAVMKRSLPYRDYIRSEIERQDVPLFLLYLPIIESGFSVNAISRSGATGMWQFMKNSIGGYGIRINEWMDERKDPWITTNAALKKLKYNYNYLGDWYLALAAYNCGLGATKLAIQKGGKADYWYLSEKGYFKTETVHYVPKLLAIADILSRGAEYGIDEGDSGTNTVMTTLEIKRAIDIGLLAKETGIDPALLKLANPALFYYITPPDMTYALRIPSEREEAVKALLADTNRLLLEYYMYKIKSGDTLYALALHYGISVDMIVQSNPGLKVSTLKIGKNIVIPALKDVKAYAGKKDPENLDFSGSYLVKQGDSLWSIALAYNIQVETLADRNNLDVNSVLKLGKALHVPIL